MQEQELICVFHVIVAVLNSFSSHKSCFNGLEVYLRSHSILVPILTKVSVLSYSCPRVHTGVGFMELGARYYFQVDFPIAFNNFLNEAQFNNIQGKVTPLIQNLSKTAAVGMELGALYNIALMSFHK